MRKLAKAKWISVLLLYTFAFGITDAEAGIRDRIRQRRTPQRASQKKASKSVLPTVQGQQPQALSGPQYPPPSVNSLRGTQNLPASNDGWVFTFDSSNGLWGPEAPSGGAGASTLDDLTDVIIGSHTSGKFLRANGTNFVDANIAINDISNIVSTTPSTGQYFRYNGTNYVNANISTNDITGISVTSQSAGEVLRSNGTNFVDATLDFDDLANTTITSWSAGEVPRWNGSALVDSKLASTDLSDFAGTIVGNSGDIVGWNGSAWDDLTLTIAITNMYGNGTSGQALTSDGVGGVSWQTPSGGGISVTGTPTNGDTIKRNTFTSTWIPTKHGAGVVDCTDYGASPNGNTYTTGAINSASPTLTVAANTTFEIGQQVAVFGAGATHGLSVPAAPFIGIGGTAGSTTYAWAIAALSGDGGCTQVSTATSNATGNATLSLTNYAYVCWLGVAGADGYLISGRSNTQSVRSIIAQINGAFNAKAIVFQAGSYTNPIQTDIGKPVVGQAGSDGILAGWDPTSRTWWVIPSVFGSDPFTSNGTVTITGGTGTGISTSVTDAYAWKDTGDLSPVNQSMVGGVETGGTPQPSLARRVSSPYHPGDMIKHPNDTTGVYYVATELNPNLANFSITSSTATSSLTLGTTPGQVYQDGDIGWMCIQTPIPSDEPTAAIPDVHIATINNVVSTTITLGTNASNTVSGAVVAHTELAAINATYAAANTAGCEAYYKPGYFNVFLGEPDANTWSQWTATNGPFVWNMGNGTTRWGVHLDPSACIMINPMSFRANSTDTGTIDCFYASNGGNNFYYKGGRTIMTPICEGRFIQQDGWSKTVFMKTYATGATQRVTHTEISDAEIWGFPILRSIVISNGVGFGDEINNCLVNWGGAGHDPLCYGSLQKVSFNTFYGNNLFGSDCMYTDDEATDIVNDYFIFTGNKIRLSRTNGLRLRMGHCTVTENEWIDCTGDILLCDSFTTGIIANNKVTNGGRFNIAGVNISWSNNQLVNSTLAIAGGINNTFTGGSIIWDTNIDKYTAGNTPLQINGGTNNNFSGMTIQNTETSGPDRGVMINGGTDHVFSGMIVDVLSENALTATSAFSGTYTWTGGIIDTNGAVGITVLNNASAICNMSGTIIRSGGGGLVTVSDGHCFFSDVQNYIGLSVSSAVDTFEIKGGNVGKSGSGNAAIAAPSSKIKGVTFGTTTTISGNNSRVDDCDFASEPVLTGITGLSRHNNRVNGSSISTMAALTGNTNDLLVGICDTMAFTTSGTNNYNLTGFSGLADGEEVTIFNAESSGSDIITLTNHATSAAGNQLDTVGGTSYGVDPGDRWRAVKMTASGATYYREIGRGP